MTTEQDVVDRALLACLRSDDDRDALKASLGRLSGADWDVFVERARMQRIGALAYNGITTKGVDGALPVETLQTLRRRYRSNSIRNLWLRNALHPLLSAFREAGISVILLKGAYLATQIYHNPAVRQLSDLDFLVRRCDFGEGLRLLQGAGFHAKEPLPVDIAERVTTAKHAPRLIRDKVAVELHWTIFSPGTEDAGEVDALFARAVPATVSGVDTLGLSPEDLLLHVCGHAAYDHKFEFGLRPLCDIDCIIRDSRHTIRWPEFVGRASAWGWARGVGLTLLLARRLLGTMVPEDVLETLEQGSPDEAVISAAEGMVFTDSAFAISVHRNVTRLQHMTIKERVRLLYERMRWCPEQTDPTLRYYVRHVPSLVLRHTPTVFRLLIGDQPTRQVAERKRTLADWLAEDAGPAGSDTSSP